MGITWETNLNNTKPRRVCFSFAAYARNLIDHLIDSNVPVAEGLSEGELAAVESAFDFRFPPDLRHILQEGLPVGPGFPNWRSSSIQQLDILLNLPVLGICKEISRRNFWVKSWGDKPENMDEAVKLAKRFLKKAPVLVPIYRNFYIPDVPNLAGNPVFYVNGGEIRVSSFDIAGVFQIIDFESEKGVRKRPSLSSLMNAPAWAATEARRIEFWTDLAAPAAQSRCERRWWSGGYLAGCMEEVCSKLKDGGWRQEEVREMTMMDGGDERDRKGRCRLEDGEKFLAGEGLARHLRILALRLLRAGWSREDVVDSLGWNVESGSGGADVESWWKIQHLKYLRSSSLEAM
ncbi:hypothetical protein NMG60_11006041 [Bertholletia excelsa]